MPWLTEQSPHITWDRLHALMRQTVEEARRRICAKPRRVLLLPPDVTRMHSGAGRLTEMLYQELAGEADVRVIPTLGQHVPHTVEVNRTMFGTIPNERIHAHDWRDGVVHMGDIPGEVVREAVLAGLRPSRVSAASGDPLSTSFDTGNLTPDTSPIPDWPIPVYLNRKLMTEPWDLVINIGHVVPHEVLGFANHNKNYLIGLGGKPTICAAHMAAACYGIENNLGQLITPLRACFNWAEEKFLGSLPDFYVQVVLSNSDRVGDTESGRGGDLGQRPLSTSPTLVHTGLYVGDDLETYLAAARQSREQNITVFDEPVDKIVCVMQADEFHSTWVANKAVYRTRMALADGGELVIIAPGLRRFGEQPEVDTFIRKYAYSGTPAVMAGYRQHADMQDLAHATAHLIHGSSEGRFRITYAPGHLTSADIATVGYNYLDITEALNRYQPENCRPGWNTTADSERFYFIPTPSAGLWAAKQRMI